MMGALPGGMTRGPAGMTGRFGPSGGPGPMMGGLGGMAGLPPGMLTERPGGGGLMSIPGTDPRVMDARLQPPPMDAGLGSMMGGGASGMRRPLDVMYPPMGPSTASDTRPPDVMMPPMGPSTSGTRPPDIMVPPMGPTDTRPADVMMPPTSRGPSDMMVPPMGPSMGNTRPPDMMMPPMGPTSMSTTGARPPDVMMPPMGPSASDSRPADMMVPPMGSTMVSTSVSRPHDMMMPPMGPSSTASTFGASSSLLTSTTASASELVLGEPGGMVGSLATTPGSVLLGLPQTTKSNNEPASVQLPPAPGGSGPPPPPSTRAAEPLDNDDAQRRRAGTVPPAPRITGQWGTSSVAAILDQESTGCSDQPGSSGEACTACVAGGPQYSGAASRKCPHAFCVSCAQSYFSHGETECPVCGVSDDVTGRTLTQPASGHMLTTYDNGFRLPGFESTSRGTIVVTYGFPAGIQTVCACVTTFWI